jgi:protein-S-isoprenylcysteine O-methyltransferase Ste14
MSNPNESGVLEPAREPRRLELKIPPPVIVAAVATGMWAAAQALPPLGIPAALRIATAAAIAVAGVILSAWGIAAFRRARTTINPHRPGEATALVCTGPYRFTRNPMYAGMLLVLVAWAVFLASLPASLGPLVFILYINRFQIESEERALRWLFGGEYVAYKARVRRWL